MSLKKSWHSGVFAIRVYSSPKVQTEISGENRTFPQANRLGVVDFSYVCPVACLWHLYYCFQFHCFGLQTCPPQGHVLEWRFGELAPSPSSLNLAPPSPRAYSASQITKILPALCCQWQKFGSGSGFLSNGSMKTFTIM